MEPTTHLGRWLRERMEEALRCLTLAADDRTHDRNLARYRVLRHLAGRDPRNPDHLAALIAALPRRGPLATVRDPAFFQRCWEAEVRNLRRHAGEPMVAA